MAKLYKQMQKALSSYEDRPEGIIMEAKHSDSLFIIRGKDKGRDAWHAILVPIDKKSSLEAVTKGSTVDITEFGEIIRYRNHRGNIESMSHWGKDPSEMIMAWMNENYSEPSIDHSISMVYEEDDIRLCTMQRAIPEQRLGVICCSYKRQERFHYVKLVKDSLLSLAHRGGIKDYDRVVFLNGINIENDTFNQFLSRFDINRHLPVQMLVCSPATYAHYKANNKHFHIDLPTVHRLTPVYATATSDSNTDTPIVSADPDSFCCVQWDDSGTVSIVSQSAVYKSPQFTKVNDICFVEREGNHERGRILHIGSYHHCERLKTKLPMQKKIMNEYWNSTWTKPLFQKSIIKAVSTLEELPNEILLNVFTYLNIVDLYNGFWGVNERFNNLFQSYENLCLIFEEKTDDLLLKSYARFATGLVIDTPKRCDLTQFSNLKTLVLCDSSSAHLQQIRSDIIPKLSHLSFLLGSKFSPSAELINNVFSNQFPSLRRANLSRVNELSMFKWSISPSLRFVSIRSNNPLIVSCILGSCPYLHHLQLHVFDKIPQNAVSSPSKNHPLRWFTLWSDSLELTSAEIADLLSNTPNVQRLYLQTVYSALFISLVSDLINQLNYLSHFNCHIKEMTNKSNRINKLTTIHQLHPCLSRIQCNDEDEDFRIFYTK